MVRLRSTLLVALCGGISLAACDAAIGPQGGTGGNPGPGVAGSGDAGTGHAGAGAGGGGIGGGSSGAAGTGAADRGGTTGSAGSVGPAGSAATTGSAGATGSAGTTGNAGTTGRGGTTGSAGRGGSTGSGGAAGTAGRGGSGAVGASGGSGGTTGSAGTTGGAGTTGSGGGKGDVCARWKADRADLSEGTWSGDAASCTAGDMGAAARANALRLVNLYRWLAELPAVVTDPTKDMQDQQCALMMRANNMISHEPDSSWLCYTPDGATAAGSSNVSSGRAVSSVDLYMIDPGNPTTIGHRRWILSNSLGPIGIGGTDRASCMWTLNGTGKAGKPWMAWPAPGAIPLQAVSPRGTTVDSTGWSVQSDNINLANAQVTVTVDGVAQPVTVTQLGANYGSKYAIRFNPMGWTTAAGKTYAVAVTNVPTAINYSVQIVDCP